MSQTLIFSGGGPWTLDDARYDGDFLDTTSQDFSPEDVEFDTSGKTMFVLGSNTKRLDQYSLSTPWDVSTGTPVQVTNVSGQASADPSGLAFRPNGIDAYVVGGRSIDHYQMVSAWNVSGATIVESVASVNVNNQSHAIVFNPNGLKAIIGRETSIEEIVFTSAWSVSANSKTASYATSPFIGSLEGLEISPDGETLFAAGEQKVVQFALSSAWSLELVTPVQSLDIGAETDAVRGIAVGDGGNKMFIADDGASFGEAVYRYSL